MQITVYSITLTAFKSVAQLAILNTNHLSIKPHLEPTSKLYDTLKHILQKQHTNLE
jgi:hypothetical protein